MRTRLLLVALLALATRAHAQDLSGVWDVSGTDPALGAYSGEVDLVPSGTSWSFVRLVEVATLLPDGRTLALSWEGTATLAPSGVKLDVALRRQEFVAEYNGLARGPADKIPLALSATLGPALPAGAPAPGTAISGTFPGGPTETWTKTARAPSALPRLEVRRDAVPISSFAKKIYFALFKPTYWTLPAVAPYVSRPEFQAGDGIQIVDTTARDWTLAHPDRLLVVQKVPDAIALLEEDLRASAFRWHLHEKAEHLDADMNDHIEASTGMLGGIEIATKAHVVHGDSGLHQGSWVGSQAWRWLATSDPAALDNVVRGTKALILMCDAPGDPAQFARAVQDSSTAPANWARSTVLPGIAYLPGGNNDMMHGVDYGFATAEMVLPAGHPLLADIGARAKSLVLNHKEAKSGTHEIVLAGIASRLTGDPQIAKEYKKRVAWSPLDLLWLASGEGISLLPEISGRSGPHLGTLTVQKFRILGGASPSFLEKLWRWSAGVGIRHAFTDSVVMRPGLVAVVAAAAGHPAAAATAKDVLAEVPYPRPAGSARIDQTIDPAFCLLPYPAMPWKLDFMKNPGREQSVATYPIFQWPASDNWWKEGPFSPFEGRQDPVRWSSQDYLHAYWYGRAQGVLSATD